MRALRSYWSYYSKWQLMSLFVLLPVLMALVVVLGTYEMRLIWCVTALYVMEEVTMSGICSRNENDYRYLLSSPRVDRYFQNIFRTDMVIKTIYIMTIAFVCCKAPGTRQIASACLAHLWLLLNVLCVRFFGKNSACPVPFYFIGMLFFYSAAHDDQIHMAQIWWLLAIIDIGLMLWEIRICEKRVMEGYYD